jgi:hypothetical protein
LTRRNKNRRNTKKNLKEKEREKWWTEVTELRKITGNMRDWRRWIEAVPTL